MTEDQLIKSAGQMFLDGKSRGDVITFFESNNITDARAEELATQSYRSIQDQRKKMLDDQDFVTEEQEDGMARRVIFGVIGGFIMYLIEAML